MRIALDTNVLAYAEGLGDEARCAAALQLMEKLRMRRAAENRCRLLLSEDFQDGFTWRGVTVANPFAAQRSPLLHALLNP
jgi:predicted nucleic acid-binding protein